MVLEAEKGPGREVAKLVAACIPTSSRVHEGGHYLAAFQRAFTDPRAPAVQSLLCCVAHPLTARHSSTVEQARLPAAPVFV